MGLQQKIGSCQPSNDGGGGQVFLLQATWVMAVGSVTSWGEGMVGSRLVKQAGEPSEECPR